MQPTADELDYFKNDCVEQFELDNEKRDNLQEEQEQHARDAFNNN